MHEQRVANATVASPPHDPTNARSEAPLLELPRLCIWTQEKEVSVPSLGFGIAHVRLLDTASIRPSPLDARTVNYSDSCVRQSQELVSGHTPKPVEIHGLSRIVTTVTSVTTKLWLRRRTARFAGSLPSPARGKRGVYRECTLKKWSRGHTEAKSMKHNRLSMVKQAVTGGHRRSHGRHLFRRKARMSRHHRERRRTQVAPHGSFSGTGPLTGLTADLEAADK